MALRVLAVSYLTHPSAVQGLHRGPAAAGAGEGGLRAAGAVDRRGAAGGRREGEDDAGAGAEGGGVAPQERRQPQGAHHLVGQSAAV